MLRGSSFFGPQAGIEPLPLSGSTEDGVQWTIRKSLGFSVGISPGCVVNTLPGTYLTSHFFKRDFRQQWYLLMSDLFPLYVSAKSCLSYMRHQYWQRLDGEVGRGWKNEDLYLTFTIRLIQQQKYKEFLFTCF